MLGPFGRALMSFTGLHAHADALIITDGSLSQQHLSVAISQNECREVASIQHLKNEWLVHRFLSLLHV